MTTKLLLSLILILPLQVCGSNENPVDEFLYETIIKHAGPAGKKVLTYYPLAREIVSYLDLENDMYQALGRKSFNEKDCNYQKVKDTISQTILYQKLLRKNKPNYTLQLANIPALNDYRLPYVHPQKPDTSIKLLSRVHSNRFIWFDPIFEHNDIKTAKIMLRCGADITAVDWNGYSMLHRACTQGNEAIAKLAIDYGADVNQRTHSMCFLKKSNPKGFPTLYTAVNFGKSLSIARMLLEKGADINAQSCLNETPLMAALSTDILQKDLVTLLLQYKPDFSRKNYEGKTCLHKASYHSLDHVKILLENGAQSVINVQDNRGQTPLHTAVKYGITDNVKLLLDHNANAKIQDNDGKTPFDYVDDLFNEKNKKIIENLLKTHTK